MNAVLPSRYLELANRLLLGLQPMDAPRAQRIAHAVEMRVEPKQWTDPLTDEQQRYLRACIDARVPLSNGWKRVQRHPSCRHVLRYAPGHGTHVDVRVLDSSQRFVPRRLQVPLTSLGVPESTVLLDALPVGQRSRSPSFFPGAAYDVSERVTGLRGRVVVSDAAAPGTRVPVRWARIEARLAAGGPPVAWAHGDQHGEFLLVLPPEATAAPAAQLPLTPRLEITVHGRRGLPVPAPPALVRRADPFWDLPLEVLGAPGSPESGDLVALGRAIPAGYDGSVTRSVTFVYSQIVSNGIAPFDIT
jgi:hypothetical protein